ncbi:DUF2304 domain-containing protein [uncultured Slackia sp.]|uniref:DUF2304 domain-containing protein n=1 Tax=uncultured Slackia sp. TaxID=665903 RepID=UPI00280BF9A5|nr:DUF2304 domain-containing protein [uncultured Slackia sp.]
MNNSLRIFLLLGAIATLYFIIRKIRKSEMETSDSVFWFVFSGVFVLLALFPQIAYACSHFLGFSSPSNFIFLVVIAILVIKEFSLTLKIARLRIKMNKLVQEIALRSYSEK